MPLRLLEYVPEDVVLKELLWNFHKIQILRWNLYFWNHKNVFSFAGASKTHVLLFTKVTNENTESISRAYTRCTFNIPLLNSSLTSHYD